LDQLSLPSWIDVSSPSESSALQPILQFLAGWQSSMLNLAAIVILVLIFGLMYSRVSPAVLLELVTRLAQRFWLLGMILYSTLLLIRPWLLATEAATNPVTSHLLSAESHKNHILSLAFLVVLAILHLFIRSVLSASTQISPEVPLLTYLVAAFGWILLGVEDFALFLVCLEGFSLTLYILATTGRLYGGISAAIKYFIFGTLGSIFLYWGALSTFELTAGMNAFQLPELLSQSLDRSEVGPEVYSKAVLAQTLILMGFLIKLGAAPLHQWVADVYAGVPFFVTAFYSIFVKLVLFVLFLRFALSFASAKEVEFAALLSLIVGCFGTLRQVDIKRFLAYGSIAHTGYLLMGDLTATYTYLATYVLASLLFFSVLLSARINGRELIYLADLRFLGQSRNLMDRTVLVVVLASMAGLPPFAGFYGKMLVWTSLMEDIYLFNDTWSYILLLTNLLTSLIMMFYYMQVMCTLYVNDETVETNVVTYNGVDTGLTTTLQYIGVALVVLWTFVMPCFLSVVYSLL
jgi:NADH-quinone oxidoreductase subunit N